MTEEKYNEKVSGNSKDVAVEWKCKKQISDYFVVEVAVKFEARGLTDVEVEIDGKKRKTNKGVIVTEIKGALIKDPSSTWEAKPSYLFLRELYNKYIVPGRIDTMEDKTKDDVRGFKEHLKHFLESTGRR